MKLHSSVPSGVNTITGYGEGYVMINGERRASSVVVLPDRVEPWQAGAFDTLTPDDFQFQIQQHEEILFLQDIERLDVPRQQLIGQHDQVCLVALVVDHHIAFAVGGESVERRGRRGVELHC